jgi:hypothetical protein
MRPSLQNLLLPFALVAGMACESTSTPPADASDVGDGTDGTDAIDVTAPDVLDAQPADAVDSPDGVDILDVSDVPEVPDVAPDLAPDAASGCYLPGYGLCPKGLACVTARCADGSSVTCSCVGDGSHRCVGACPSAADAGAGCALPNGRRCPVGTSCALGRCADGSPVACACADGERVRCTAACPAPSPIEASCGGLRGTRDVQPDCGPARVLLDPALCRCILGYWWDGRGCVPLSNCRCLGNCELLFEDEGSCIRAFGRCS